jgi:hypothetical protein
MAFEAAGGYDRFQGVKSDKGEFDERVLGNSVLKYHR